MKLAIVVRKDLGMRTGKIAVQVGHASVTAFREAYGTPEGVAWYHDGQKKIVLKVPTGKQLLEIYEMAKFSGLPSFEIEDFGLTQVEPGSITCVAIGPDEDKKIDAVIKGLLLL